MGGDLLPLALDVCLCDFHLRPLGEERARCHGQRRRHRSRNPAVSTTFDPPVAPDTPLTIPNTAASPSFAP
jgi:hypothetical protein